MEPKEGAEVAAEAAATLTQAMTKTTDPNALKALLEGLSVVVARMEPKEAATMLVQAVTKTTEPPALQQALASGLVAVLGDVRPHERPMAIAATVGCLCDGNNLPSALLLLNPKVKPLPRRLSDQDLVELLKDPLCVGWARRAVLYELGDRYQRHFADQWEFVHFVQEQHLDLDLLTPPKRR